MLVMLKRIYFVQGLVYNTHVKSIGPPLMNFNCPRTSITVDISTEIALNNHLYLMNYEENVPYKSFTDKESKFDSKIPNMFIVILCCHSQAFTLLVIIN